MKIIDRYILKQFVFFFAFMLVGLSLCFVIVDFFGKVRMFLSNHASLMQILRYFYYLTPSIFSQMIPASMLLSTLITLGNFSRSNEIVALKASGTSIYRASLPIVCTAIIAIPFNFFLSEYIATSAKDRAERILTVEVKKEKMHGTFVQNQIWYRGAEGIYNFSLLDPKNLTLRGVTLHLIDRNFQLRSIINADSATWKGSGWELVKVQFISFSENGEILVEYLKAMKAPISETPEDFLTAQKSPDRMGFKDLYLYVKKLKGEGYDTTPYLADLHGKIAFSLAGLILVPIGLAFGIRAERSGGLAQGITLGAVIGFSYWLVFAFFLSLGRSGALPPWLAPWVTNLLFLAVSIVLARRVPT